MIKNASGSISELVAVFKYSVLKKAKPISVSLLYSCNESEVNTLPFFSIDTSST